MKDMPRLRNIGPADLEVVREWRNAKTNRMNMYTRHIITREEHLAWWETIQAGNNDRYFLYEDAVGGRGVVSFNNVDRVNRNAAWGFYSAPAAPRGTGSRMLFLALEYAFGELGLHKVYSEVISMNSYSLKLHEKLGFLPEGVFREQHLYEGIYMDVHRLGILSLEWAEIRESMQAKVFRNRVKR